MHQSLCRLIIILGYGIGAIYWLYSMINEYFYPRIFEGERVRNAWDTGWAIIFILLSIFTLISVVGISRNINIFRIVLILLSCIVAALIYFDAYLYFEYVVAYHPDYLNSIRIWWGILQNSVIWTLWVAFTIWHFFFMAIKSKEVQGSFILNKYRNATAG